MKAFFAVPVPGPITIDGTLDEWDLSGQIQSYADSSLKDVFSVKTAAMWDAENFYLSFDWRDPYPLESQYHPLQDPTRGWRSDSVQLRVLAGDQPSWITTWCFEGDKPAIHAVYLTAGGTKGLAERPGADGQLLLYVGEPGVTELGDAETGVLQRTYSLSIDSNARRTILNHHAVALVTYSDELHCTGMTCVGNVVYYIVDRRGCQLDLDSGVCNETPIQAAVCPVAITHDAQGDLYIADCGPAQQIVKCTKSGQELLRIR